MNARSALLPALLSLLSIVPAGAAPLPDPARATAAAGSVHLYCVEQ